MIHLKQSDLNSIQNILSQFPYTFYAFGSRVRGNHKPFSDLDLCVMEEMPELTKSLLAEALEESNITIKIDIIEWKKISQAFRDLIKNDLVLVSHSGKREATG